jgi:hypothetical protein
MKKFLCIALILCLLPFTGAFALNYKQCLSNEATFETLEEAHANGPAFLSSATGRTYVADPALDTYPQGTSYVYRAANTFTCLSAGARMNTNILVYTDKSFENKDAVLAYLKELGLTGIVDKAHGSIVLVTPADPKAGFGAADQYAFYQLQSAMCNITYSKKVDDKTTNFYADNSYFGGLTYRYVIGIDGGATFLNNYVASTFDYVSRIAGMLLIGGSMDRIRNVAAIVPAYLVNASETAIEKYKAANAVDALSVDGDVSSYYNQAQPLQKVCVNNSSVLDANLISNVYSSFFTKAMRVPVLKAGLYAASTPYSNYNWNQAPYSLCERNALLDGMTPDGLKVVEHIEDRFNSITTDKGEYLQYWLEVLPKEVLDNTAPAGSVPLVLATHGSGDDPLQFLDEDGLLAVAGKERFAIVAPYHQQLSTDVVSQVMPKLVQYMLDTYPALNASRVYSTGYSMGGGAAILSVLGNLKLFAAVAPQGAVARPATEEQTKQFDSVDLPALFITSTNDFYILGDKAMSDGSTNPLADHQGMVNMFLTINGMKNIVFDFDTYRYFGAKADIYQETKLNNEYTNRMWFLKNADGIPMLGYSVTDFLPHGLYPEYGKLAWNFLKHYTRDLASGSIVYNPYVD